MTYNKTKPFNDDNNLQIKVGNEVPENAVNLSYYSVPKLEPESNVDVFNDLINKHYFLNSYSNQEFYSYAEKDQKLHIIEDREDTFYFKDFVMTDVLDKKDDRYYYKYELNYHHLTSAETNVAETLSLTNVNGEEIDPKIIDFEIVPQKVGESFGLSEYKVYLFFSNKLDFDIYIKYNPKNIKIQKYKELISLEKIYTNTSYSNIKAHKNDIDYFHYHKKDISEGYNLFAPVAASKDENSSIHNMKFTDFPSYPFTYQIQKEQLEESSSEGVAISFVIDTSGSMGGTDGDVNAAVNNFINRFTDPDDYITSKFNIVYFDGGIDGVDPGNYFADEEDNLRCHTNSSGGTNIPLGLNKSISIFNSNSSELNGYKKNIILLTDGNDGTSDSRFRNINNNAKRVGINKIYAIGMGGSVDTGALKAASDKYYSASNSSQLMSIYNEIEEECRPKIKPKEIHEESSSVDKIHPGYFEVDTDSEMQSFEGKELKVTATLDGNDKLKYEFVQMSHGYIVQRFGHTVPVNTKNVYLRIYTEVEVTLYSRLYCIKSEEDSSKIYAKLDEDLEEDDNWYLDVHNGMFSIEKEDDFVNYSIPEFKEQEFCSEYGMPYKKDQKIIGTEKREVTLNEKNLHLIEGTKNIDDSEVVVIDNINIEKAEGGNNYATSANSQTGTITLYDQYKKEQKATYFYEEKWYNYNGFYDENNNFIHLDLNPRKNHFSTLKKPYTTNEPEMVPTYDLFNIPIYLYIKPSSRYNKPSDEILFEKDYTLFHTIGEKLKEGHPFIESDIGNGYYEFDDVKLVATLYVKPYLNSEESNIIDTRTRGGGLKDIEYNYLDNIHKDIKPVFDKAPWDGIPYNKNSVVVLDLPESVLDDFTEEEIRKKINKYLALGTLLVINYVKEDKS